MENKAHAIAAGLFLLLLGLALAASVAWFQGDRTERVHYTVVARSGVPDDQAGAFATMPGAHGAQFGVQLQHAGVDELHPPVGAGQRIEDLGVEHEHAPDLPALFERMVQRCVVLHPQVAPEPHQAAVVACHGKLLGEGGLHRGPPLKIGPCLRILPRSTSQIIS